VAKLRWGWLNSKKFDFSGQPAAEGAVCLWAKKAGAAGRSVGDSSTKIEMIPPRNLVGDPFSAITRQYQPELKMSSHGAEATEATHAVFKGVGWDTRVRDTKGEKGLDSGPRKRLEGRRAREPRSKDLGPRRIARLSTMTRNHLSQLMEMSASV
jgi:hypothetical protein